MLLNLLLPLLKRKEFYVVSLVGSLGLALWLSRHQVKDLQAALAARPTVEAHTQTKVETKTVTKIVRGPERVVTKYAEGKVVEKIVYRDPVELTIGKEQERETEASKTVTPSCGGEGADRWRFAGVMVDPTAPAKLVGLRGGVTLWRRLDLGAGFRFSPHAEGQAELGLRF